MGLATLVGSLLPALPYWVLPVVPATAVAGIIVLLVVMAIAELRVRTRGPGDAATTVFGGFDGLTCALTVIGADLWTHQSLRTIVISAAGLAGGGAVSMAMGEWLADRFGVKRSLAYLQTLATLVLAVTLGIGLSVVAGAVG